MQQFSVQLSTLDQDVILTLSTATVAIEDNDSECYVIFSMVFKDGKTVITVPSYAFLFYRA